MDNSKSANYADLKHYEMSETQLLFQYYAFISYSHHDEGWSKWLHKNLETYSAHQKLKAKDERFSNLPDRIYPVFRDREELAASSDLPERIKEALKQSRFLIVICSPNAAQSRWVNEEILEFKALGREKQILTLIVDGEPNASTKLEVQLKECFPEALRYKFEVSNQVSEKHFEPIAADARPDKDGKRNAFLKLIAGLLEIPFSALKQRDQERQIRFMLSIGTVMGLIIIIVSSLGFFAWVQRNDAIDQRKRAEHQKTMALNAIKKLTYELPDRLEQLPGTLNLSKTLFEENVELLDKVLKFEADTPEAQRDRFTNFSRMGDRWFRMGELTKANDAYVRAEEIIANLVTQYPGNGLWESDLSLARRHLGDVLAEENKWDKALAIFTKVLEIDKKVAESNLSEPDAQWRLSISHSQVGRALRALNKPDKALNEYEMAWNAAERGLAIDPSNRGLQRELSVLKERIGDVLHDQGKHEDAIKRYAEAIQITRYLVEKDPENLELKRDLVVTKKRIANILGKDQYIQEAIDLYEDVISQASELVAQNSDNTQLKVDLADTLEKRGDFWADRNEYYNAELDYQGAFGLRLELAKIDSSRLSWQLEPASILLKLGNVYGSNQYTKALIQYGKAREVLEELYAIHPDDTRIKDHLAETYFRIAFAELYNHRPKEAIYAAGMGLKLLPDSANIKVLLAHAYLFDNQYQKAEALYIANKNAQLNGQQRSFAEEVLYDFEEFKKRSLAHPDMESIEHLLRQP